MTIKVNNHAVLFWIGVLGVIFYVAAPVLFPGVPNLRQPELLPVYTLMMGLGQLLKGNTEEKATNDFTNKSEQQPPAPQSETPVPE